MQVTEAEKKTIKNTLDSMKKLHKKDWWKLLTCVSVPQGVNEKLDELTKSFRECVVKEKSRVSVLTKFKNMLGIGKTSKKEDKIEELKQRLTKIVIEFGSARDAYICFFVGCSNARPILNTFLQKFDEIMTRSRKYIDSEVKLRKDPSWAKNYNKKLLELSELYNFNNKNITFNFSDFENTKGLSRYSYRNRAIIVYQHCRDIASKIKKELEEKLLDRLGKLKANDAICKLVIDTELTEVRDQITAEIKKRTEQSNQLTELMNSNKKIFNIPEVKTATENLLKRMKHIVDELKFLSKNIATDSMIFIMKTNIKDLNTSHISAVSSAQALFRWLTELKNSLSSGEYNKALKLCEYLDAEQDNATTALKYYATATESFAAKADKTTMMVRDDVNKQVRQISNELDTKGKNFDTNFDAVKNLPDQFKQKKANAVTNYATTVIGSCSMVLGPYTNILSKLVSGFGPTVGMKVANMYYAN